MPELRSLRFVQESVGHPNSDAHFAESGDKIEIPPTVLDGHGAGIATEKASVRIDPELTLRLDTDGALGRGAVVLEGSKRLMPAGLEGTLLPRDLDTFGTLCDSRRTEVGELLEEGRVLVEAVERLVCRLYGVPVELEEAVVRHAAARAVAGLPAEE